MAAAALSVTIVLLRYSAYQISDSAVAIAAAVIVPVALLVLRERLAAIGAALAMSLADFYWIEPTGQFGVNTWIGLAQFAAAGVAAGIVVIGVRRIRTFWAAGAN